MIVSFRLVTVILYTEMHNPIVSCMSHVFISLLRLECGEMYMKNVYVEG